jgi:predicted amidohydrolase
MRTPRIIGLCLTLLLLLAGAAAASGAPVDPPAPAGPPFLRVAAVQLHLTEPMLRSFAAFEERIAALTAAAAAHEPDLIVFPEYTGVFLALVPYASAWGGGEDLTVETAFAAIRRREGLAGSLKELFLLNSGLTERAVDEIFGGLARRFRVPVLAGSYFAYEGKPGGRGELRNRAVLFGPAGERLYSQDKVFLTDYESALLGLAPGRREEARPFVIAGRSLGLTVCRDTYDPGWEEHFRDLDLWIDIKANGAAFDRQERQSFQRALPARIAASGVPLGLTVCLTGEFLELFWEGESSLVRREAEGVRYLWRAADPKAEEIALLLLEPDAGRAAAE